MIRKGVAWIISWILFGVGYLIHRLFLDDLEKFNEFVYDIYNTVMNASFRVQEWGGNENSPWRRAST